MLQSITVNVGKMLTCSCFFFSSGTYSSFVHNKKSKSKRFTIIFTDVAQFEAKYFTFVSYNLSALK